MEYLVNMTDRGVITLPMALRKKLGLKANDQFQVEITPRGILLTPIVTVPIEVYSEERLQEFADSEKNLERKMK
jgi:antitoxin PrlF